MALLSICNHTLFFRNLILVMFMDNLFDIKRVGYYISKIHWTKPVSSGREVENYEFELYTNVSETGASLINGKEYPYKKGNMLIAKPGMKRQSMSQFECYYVHFSCKDKKFEEKYLKTLPTIVLPYNTNEFISIFKKITEATISKPEGYSLFTAAKLAEMISLLYGIALKKNNRNSKYLQYEFNVNDAIVFMNTNYKERITLHDIANSANLSPSYFHLVFKDIIGVSPYEFLLNIRINHAKNLLMNSKLSLGKIAEETGFGSQAYFNYVFKKELDITPNAYRSEKSIIL